MLRLGRRTATILPLVLSLMTVSACLLLWRLVSLRRTTDLTHAELSRPNWQRYVSNQWGFAIEYPGNWRIETSVYGLNISDTVPNDNGFYHNIGINYYEELNQTPRYGGKSEQRHYASLSDYIDDQGYVEVRVVSLSGKGAYFVSRYNPVLNYTGTELVTEHSGRVYVIGVPNPLSETDKEILASFRFLDGAPK